MQVCEIEHTRAVSHPLLCIISMVHVLNCNLMTVTVSFKDSACIARVNNIERVSNFI